MSKLHGGNLFPPLFGSDLLVILLELHNHDRGVIFVVVLPPFPFLAILFHLPKPKHAFKLELRGRLDLPESFHWGRKSGAHLQVHAALSSCQ